MYFMVFTLGMKVPIFLNSRASDASTTDTGFSTFIALSLGVRAPQLAH
jgi:hypothetical protein